MQRVQRQDTAPELRVRRRIHAAGLRFVLHPRYLPGCPDLVLPRRRTVVFVHGCFWHGHGCKHGSTAAKTNAEFWSRKIAQNRARDMRQRKEIRKLGWWVEVVWECETLDAAKLARLARRLLLR